MHAQRAAGDVSPAVGATRVDRGASLAVTLPAAAEAHTFDSTAMAIPFGAASNSHSATPVATSAADAFPTNSGAARTNGHFPLQRTAAIGRHRSRADNPQCSSERYDAATPRYHRRFPLRVANNGRRFPLALEALLQSAPSPSEADNDRERFAPAPGDTPEANDAKARNFRNEPNDNSDASRCDCDSSVDRQPTDIAAIGLGANAKRSLSPPSLMSMTPYAAAKIQVQAHDVEHRFGSRRFINDAAISTANAINTVAARTITATISAAIPTNTTSASVGADQYSSAFGDIFRETASDEAATRPPPQPPLSGQIINDNAGDGDGDGDGEHRKLTEAKSTTTTPTAPALSEISAAAVDDDGIRSERLASDFTDLQNDSVDVDVNVDDDDGTTIVGDSGADNELSTQLSGGCSDVRDTSSQEVHRNAARAVDLAASETWPLRESLPQTQRQRHAEREEQENQHDHNHDHDHHNDYDNKYWVRRDGNECCRAVAAAGGSVSDTNAADGWADISTRRRRQAAQRIGDRAPSDRIAMTITKIEDSEEQEQLISVHTATVASSDIDTDADYDYDDYDADSDSQLTFVIEKKLNDNNDNNDNKDDNDDYSRTMKFEMKSVKGALPSASVATAARLRGTIKMEPPLALRRRSGTDLVSSVRGNATPTTLGSVPATATAPAAAPAAAVGLVRSGYAASAALSVDGAPLDTVLPARTLLRRQRRMLSQDSLDPAKQQQPPEDPIERLNRLRARITGALSEVKGVLQQYSTETEPEGGVSTVELAIANGPEARPNDDGPVTFRFVRKVRRRSVFQEEEEDQAKAEAEEAAVAATAAKAAQHDGTMDESKSETAKLLKQPVDDNMGADVQSIDTANFGTDINSTAVEQVIGVKSNETTTDKLIEKLGENAKNQRESGVNTSEALTTALGEHIAAVSPKKNTEKRESQIVNDQFKCSDSPENVEADFLQPASVRSESKLLEALPVPALLVSVESEPTVSAAAAKTSVVKTKPKRRQLLLTAKDGVRRASIAAVERSKIEPPVKPDIPLAVKIQRRPSDSEAMARRRSAAKTIAVEGRENLAVPAPAKVRVVSKVVSRGAGSGGKGGSGGSSAVKGATTTTTSTELGVKVNAAATAAAAAAHIEANRGEERARFDDAVPTATTTTKTQSMIYDAPLTTITAAAATTTTTTTTGEKSRNETIELPANETIATAAAAKNEATRDSGSAAPSTLDPNGVMVAPLPSPLQSGEAACRPHTPSSPRSPPDATTVSSAAQQLHELLAETIIVVAAEEHVPPPPSTSPAQRSANVASAPRERSPSATVTATAIAATSTSSVPQSASPVDVAAGSTKASDTAATPNSVDATAAGVTSQRSAIESVESSETIIMPEQQAAPAPVKALQQQFAHSDSGVQAAPFNVPKDDFAKKTKVVVHKKLVRKNSTEKPPPTTLTTTTPNSVAVVPAVKAAPPRATVQDPASRDTSITKETEGTSVSVAAEQLPEQKEPEQPPTEQEKKHEVENVVADAGGACHVAASSAPPKKPRKVKKKVIIKRQQRRLSISDSTFFKGSADDGTDAAQLPDVETLEKAISYVTDDEEDDAGDSAATHSVDVDGAQCMAEAEREPPKPLKTCMRAREYEIGDWVMYAERFKKTQVRWKKGRVMERITSISYKLDIDGKEVPAHVSYIKRFTDRKVNFGGKEYLEIDYEQIAEDESKVRTYSIWNMV